MVMEILLVKYDDPGKPWHIITSCPPEGNAEISGISSIHIILSSNYTYMSGNFIITVTSERTSMMTSQITSLTIVYSTVYSGTDERKHQSSASLTFVRGIHWWLVNSPHIGPVMWKTFPFDDVIMIHSIFFFQLYLYACNFMTRFSMAWHNSDEMTNVEVNTHKWHLYLVLLNKLWGVLVIFGEKFTVL